MSQTVRFPLTYRALCLLALAAPLGACDALTGKEVARLPVNSLSTDGHEVTREATLQLKKGDEIALWSEMDLKYSGNAPVRFQVAVLKDGAAFQQLELDPTEKNISMNEVKTDFNGDVHWKFSGKNKELQIPENGAYTFTARLVGSGNPTLEVAKAELVLKQ